MMTIHIDKLKELLEAATSAPEVLGIAVGAASVCWEDVRGAGIFDSEGAKEVLDQTMARLDVLLKEQFVGYVIVDNKTGAMDWDGEVHETVAAAIASLTKHGSFTEEADDLETAHWSACYKICPVLSEVCE